ncbi:MAG: DinB family protein, partial [Thiogranum sp.]
MTKQRLNPNTIANQLEDAHQRTMELIDGLSQSQLIGPLLATVNPLLWEIGHAAYFYEYWVLRHHMNEPAIREDADRLYDSINIAHDDRWVLPLPGLQQTLAYIQAVENKVKASLTTGDDARRDYFAQYAVFHHDMHNEAYTYTCQTLNYPEPDIGRAERCILDAGSLSGDASIPGGTFMLGASQQDGFVFDNEKW